MNTRLTVACLWIILFSVAAHAQYTQKVKAALEQTATNKSELRKALDHFYKSGDGLKIRSINFLVENMPIHQTMSYYWADDRGRRIAYNELDYPTFNDAVNAFEALKTKHGKLHPVPYTYRDIDSVTGKYLIDDVEQACNAWRLHGSWLKRNGQNIGENDFLEYVLPYRVDVEAITNWKEIYRNKFKNSFTGDFSNDSVRLNEAINNSFKNLYNTDVKAEPLPRLSALQILFRGKGYCEDMADMAVFAARSQGVPATVDNIPAWATSTGDHFADYLYFDSRHRHFDAALYRIDREPGKVLRTTYSIQPDALASWLDSSNIPYGFLRLRNYKDVTNEYWATDQFTLNLSPHSNAKVVYVGVMNGDRISPLWFAKRQGNSATFTNMGKGVVYFPFYFENHRVVFADYPFALGYHNKGALKPDKLHPHGIVIKEQERYLKYRPGKRYRLLIWDNQWKLLGEQVAPSGCTQLAFSNVPRNALLLLRPEYSQGKERPFTILENGERVWW